MKETILLYNFDSAAIRNKIKFLCIQSGIHIRVVEKQQYDVPIGILACGKKEEMYCLSSFTTSSKSVMLLRPLTCHIPVSPGLVARRAR